MQAKALIMDNDSVERAITRISHEIIEKNRGVEGLIILGIVGKGIPLSKKLGAKISQISGTDIDIKHVDIKGHRDDVDRQSSDKFRFDFDIENKIIIIVDDVLYTGRTVRAALDAIVYNGRPKKVQLAVLIDRGHRELPIRPDYVGKNVPTSRDERIVVVLEDGNNKVLIE